MRPKLIIRCEDSLGRFLQNNPQRPPHMARQCIEEKSPIKKGVKKLMMDYFSVLSSEFKLGFLSSSRME